MNLPEKITFRLLNSKTKKPIFNIAASLILYAHKKNNYYVGPKISDTKGIISFGKKECIKEIDNSKKLYMMDYVSTLEECLPKISVKIKPIKEINLAVKNMRQLRDIYEKYWDCSEGHLNALSSVDNDKYIIRTYDYHESLLLKEKNKIIDIELEEKQYSV